MKAYERLLKYVKIHTASDESKDTTPTSERQFDLARILCAELLALGVDASLDEHCYVYGKLAATPGYEGRARIGFIAHMDTAPDFSGEGVKPRIIEKYDGKDVVLGDSGRVLSARDFPHLPSLCERTLIVTDGTTLLGADDKAGIAEIMTMLERVIENKIPHGQISICFTPDEEVGAGTVCFDVKRFDADFAYTLDGGEEGEVVYENFNAAGAHFEIRGVNVHPGSAKDIMVNAAAVASEINAALPEDEVPSRTSGREGFYHLTDLSGTVERAEVSYIVRDHDLDRFLERKARLIELAAEMNRKYREDTVTLTLTDQYFNMKEKILPVFGVVSLALEATHALGLSTSSDPIRGGTDGARLTTELGLPCPNLGTGGYAFHGPFEHITVEGMESATSVITEMVRLASAKTAKEILRP